VQGSVRVGMGRGSLRCVAGAPPRPTLLFVGYSPRGERGRGEGILLLTSPPPRRRARPRPRNQTGNWDCLLPKSPPTRPGGHPDTYPKVIHQSRTIRVVRSKARLSIGSRSVHENVNTNQRPAGRPPKVRRSQARSQVGRHGMTCKDQPAITAPSPTTTTRDPPSPDPRGS
jgi:hypothetical protein